MVGTLVGIPGRHAARDRGTVTDSSRVTAEYSPSGPRATTDRRTGAAPRVIGMASTPSGNGYWLATTLGQVYALAMRTSTASRPA